MIEALDLILIKNIFFATENENIIFTRQEVVPSGRRLDR